MATGMNEDVGAEAIQSSTTPEKVVEKGVSPAEASKTAEREVPNFSPLEDEATKKMVLRIHNNLLKIPGMEFHENSGKSRYIAYTVGKKKTICCLFPSKSSARLTVNRRVGKNSLFDQSIKIKGSEMKLGDKKISITALVSLAKEYIKARGWA